MECAGIGHPAAAVAANQAAFGNEEVRAMSVTFKGVEVEAQDILLTIREFDSRYVRTNDCKSWLENKAYKYAIRHDGKLYLCKHVLSRATSIHTSEFNGGGQTNRVFRELGFHVIDKP